MNKIRAFIALEMPEGLRQQLGEIIGSLLTALSKVPLRWVPIQNMHLTLKFLGDIEQARTDEITRMIRESTKRFSPLRIRLNGFGAFPNLQRARVLWVGLEVPTSLDEMVSDLEKGLEALNFAPEGRVFKPHLTLARVRDHARPEDLREISRVITSTKIPQPFAGIADRIVLFRSELRPGGSAYNALSEIVLEDRSIS